MGGELAPLVCRWGSGRYLSTYIFYKIPHVLSAEMRVLHSHLLTIAVLVPVRDSLPRLVSALLRLHHVHCCTVNLRAVFSKELRQLQPIGC